MQGEGDEDWRELTVVALRLADELRAMLPSHVEWTVRPSRRRRFLKWRVEEGLTFERGFGLSSVEISEVVRHRRMGGGRWAAVATPDEAATRLRAGIAVAVREGLDM